MGRGGYTGGSSSFNIYKGGFASHDPAAPDPGVEVYRPEVKFAKRTAAAQQVRIDQATKDYISSIIVSYQLGSILPPCPPELLSVVHASIRKAGGPLEWVRSRPEYREIYEKHRKKSVTKAGERYEADFRKAWARGTSLPELPPVIAETFALAIKEKGGVLEWTLLKLDLVKAPTKSARTFPPLPHPISPQNIQAYLLEVGFGDDKMELSDLDLEALSKHLLKKGIRIPLKDRNIKRSIT